MNILLIDTSNNKVITIGFTFDGQTHTVSKKIDFQKAQVVLVLIDKLLKKHNIVLTDITAIKVVTGSSGSFTGLRVGIAVANTLGWTLGIAVNGKRNGVHPRYSKTLNL